MAGEDAEMKNEDSFEEVAIQDCSDDDLEEE